MPSPTNFALPAGFLAGPAPNLTIQKVDWRAGGLPEYEGLFAVVLDGVLTEDECDILTAAAEATTGGEWERAMVNRGVVQIIKEDYRNCGRIIVDDREAAASIWARVEAAVPEIQRLKKRPKITGPVPAQRKEVWKVTRLNERLRFLKYTGGKHCDATYETPDGRERSYFTLQLYLNNGIGKEGEQDLEGGATSFHSLKKTGGRIDVAPKAGRVLLFQQRSLLHSGDDVVKGTKLTLRTDIMFEKEERPSTQPEWQS